LVNKLAKEAAVEDGPEVYDKIPREVLITRVKENGLKCGNSSGQIRGREW
jgi:hypothetical protein